MKGKRRNVESRQMKCSVYFTFVWKSPFLFVQLPMNNSIAGLFPSGLEGDIFSTASPNLYMSCFVELVGGYWIDIQFLCCLFHSSIENAIPAWFINQISWYNFVNLTCLLSISSISFRGCKLR